MFCHFSSNLAFISLINNKRIHCVCYIGMYFLAILEAFILNIFRGSMPRTPLGHFAPAARAKSAFGILFSPPNRKNAAWSLKVIVNNWQIGR